MQISLRVISMSIVSWLLVSACAGNTASAPAPASGFSNFLVIGVAGDYNSRAQFERATVSELRARGAAASTFYSVVGGNTEITADVVQSAVESGNFDAVLVTRVLDLESELKVKRSREEIDATPIGGRVVNLFRRNYTDYKNPGSVDLKTTVDFASELYDAARQEIVWSVPHSSKGETNLGLLIDRTAETVVSRLARADLIAD